MKNIKIEYDGNMYNCRVVKDKEGDELIIGSLEMLDALQPYVIDDETEGFADKEARRIFNKIFYFTDNDNLKLPDDKLIKVLKEANPWFF